MEETLKYINVLMESTGANITLAQDYKYSLEQVQERLNTLNGLSYSKMFCEAVGPNGKANLERYLKTDTDIRYRLPFMENLSCLLSSLQPDYWDGKEHIINADRRFRYLLDGADECKEKGLWTGEQWRVFKLNICYYEKALEDRLREFATAYNFPISTNDPEPQPDIKDLLPDGLKSDEAIKVFGKATEKGLFIIEKGKFKSCISKAQLAYLFGRLYCGDSLVSDTFGDRWKLGTATFPEKTKIEPIFINNVKNLCTIRTNNVTGKGNKRERPLPRGWEIIEALFE